MGHLNSNFPGPKTRDEESASRPAAEPKHRVWLWLLIAVVIAALGFWYFRSSKASTEAQGPSAAGGSGKGLGRQGAGAGGFAVPVVVATSQRGDLPVYFNGLGTVTAFNTVTVHSRVDGQITKINFQEGQYVHQGDALVEIDARPYQVQLEQAEGQLAKDQAQLRDVQVNYERYQLLYKEGVIPKQQVDTQGAQVGQFEGAIKADEGVIDGAKLQLVYSHVTAPISGRIVTAKLRSGGQLTVDAYDRDDTNKIESGKLLTIDNQIDTSTGTYKLKAIFNNDKEVLFPNQFVNVHLLADVKKNLTIVPAAAIQRGPQGTYVYVVQNGNTAKIQSVTIAQSTANSVGLSAGLNGGELVVIDGQDKLQDNSKVSPTTAPTGTSNAQNGNGTQQPSAQPDNAPTGAGARRRTDAAQQGHSTGKPQ